MGKSTINGHCQEQTVSLPEGNLPALFWMVSIPILENMGMVDPFLLYKSSTGARPKSFQSAPNL
jgi:hypothetical protein